MELKVNYPFDLEGHEIHILMVTHGTISEAIPKHSHSKNSYEVHYYFGGKGTLIAQNKTYAITPGTLFVTGPGVEHAQNPDSQNPLQEDCLYFYIDDHNLPDKHAHILNILRAHPFWYGQDTQNLVRTIQMLHEELSSPKIGHTIALNACFQQYLVQLARNMTSVPSHDIMEIGPVQLKIEEAFLYQYKSLTLDDICEITGLCRRQTQRLLEEYYGYGFQKKRTASRMSAASAFLLHSGLSAEDIAEAVGYSSLSSFLQAFKEYYHMTLKEYKAFARSYM